MEEKQKMQLIFAGGRKLGKEVLEWLCKQEYINVIGVCLLPESFDPDYYLALKLISETYQLPELNMTDLSNVDFDIGLSVNYNRIIGEETLNKCRNGFFNIHHSYNLRLRGRNITTHAILNSKEENIFYHGSTLHKMVPKLDAGPIVATKACSIEEDDTAYSLFLKADKIAFELVCEWIPRIIKEKVFMYAPPTEGIHYYRNKDLPSKAIDILKIDSIQLYDYVRAFDFSGYEPAYFYLGQNKIHLTINERDEFRTKINIKGRIYYTEYTCDDLKILSTP